MTRSNTLAVLLFATGCYTATGSDAGGSDCECAAGYGCITLDGGAIGCVGIEPDGGLCPYWPPVACGSAVQCECMDNTRTVAGCTGPATCDDACCGHGGAVVPLGTTAGSTTNSTGTTGTVGGPTGTTSSASGTTLGSSSGTTSIGVTTSGPSTSVGTGATTGGGTTASTSVGTTQGATTSSGATTSASGATQGGTTGGVTTSTAQSGTTSGATTGRVATTGGVTTIGSSASTGTTGEASNSTGGAAGTTGEATGGTAGETTGSTTGGSIGGSSGGIGTTGGSTGTTGGDQCGSGPVCLEITAWFDGKSELNIQGSNVWWVNDYNCVPGEDSTLQTDTTLTSCGIDAGWCPWWPVSGADDGGWNFCQQAPTNCSIYGGATSAPFTTLTPPLPAASQPNMTFTANTCREACSLAQTPDSSNGYTAIVNIDDSAFPGAAIYDVTVCYDP